MQERGLKIITDGTACHLFLVTYPALGTTGADAEKTLEAVGLTCNKNGIPFDPLPPAQTSGIRLGTPAGTTRGFGLEEFRQIGHWIADALEGDVLHHQRIRETVADMCHHFPIYTS